MGIEYEYEVKVLPEKENQFRITWFNKQSLEEYNFLQEAPRISADEVHLLRYNPDHRYEIGRKLFRFLDGHDQYLSKALTEADRVGGPLLLHLKECKEISHWPFELLANDGNYLLPHRLHLVHRLSDWGEKKPKHLKKGPLRLLFMACSPLDAPSELNFEKEEETIFQVINDLAVDMDVEDSGSIEGLRQRLEQKQYDVVHLSGYTDINKQGSSIFIMENESGFSREISPTQLWHEALIHNSPRLLFLSCFQKGMKTTDNHITGSFAHFLVGDCHLPAYLEWGYPVSDDQARRALEILYRQLSLGRSILESVQFGRIKLEIDFPSSSQAAWPFLRLFSTGETLDALVTKEQKKQPSPREMIYNQVKSPKGTLVLEGFVGRRRQLQYSLNALKYKNDKVGLLLHGIAGLGKSLLALKIHERFKDHRLITIRGKLDAITLDEALKEVFIQAQDKKGQSILSQKKEMKDKLANLCTTTFMKKNYMLLFDDFEQNLEGGTVGQPDRLLPEAAVLLETLLHYLPFSCKMTKMIITSRYLFSLTKQSYDLVLERLEPVCLTGFRVTEQEKKARELKNSDRVTNASIRNDLLEASQGNPVLMERLDKLLDRIPTSDVPQFSEAIKNEIENFITEHFLRELIRRGGKELDFFLHLFSIYRRPVHKEGVEIIAAKMSLRNWEKILQEGIRLSLIEHDQILQQYQVTPLLRGELLKSLQENKPCQEAAFSYYKGLCESRDLIDPALTEEWIYHALGCGEEDIASREAEKLVYYHAEHLDLLESRKIGEWVLSSHSNPLDTINDANLLDRLAQTLVQLYDCKKAIDYFQQALEINKVKFGQKDPNVAKVLNNIGYTLGELGEHRKALEYFQQSLDIWKENDGEKSSNILTGINNIGSAWMDLGDFNKALQYFQQALNLSGELNGEKHDQTAGCLNNMGTALTRLDDNDLQALSYIQHAIDIWRELHGEKHPRTAEGLSNLGQAWFILGNHNKALEYFKQSLNIIKEVYGEMHPQFANALIILGYAYFNRKEYQEAIKHYQQALEIARQFYGEKDYHVAKVLSNLGLVWFADNKYQEAIDYFKQALSIDESVFGRMHPKIALRLNNLGSIYLNLGKIEKAKEYYEQAYSIFKNCYGEDHPHTIKMKERLEQLI